MKEQNIEHIKVAVASPQANGQVERVNRTMKAMLGKLTEPVEHSNWTKVLLQIEFALNNTRHSSTKYAPSELLFGVLQRGNVVDEMSEFLEDRSGVHVVRDLEVMRNEAQVSIVKSQEYNEAYLSKKCKPAQEYKVGDYVVMRNVDVTIGTNKKLIPKYRGPYVIHKVLDNDRYVIRDVPGCQITQRPYDNIIEAARIKKWKDKEDVDVTTKKHTPSRNRIEVDSEVRFGRVVRT